MDNSSLYQNENGTFYWLTLTAEIKPYQSAVLGNNYISFYAIHCSAIFMISLSLIACLIVILSILCRAFERKDKWDFADRFPFYLATADFLFGVSHFADHMVLLTSQKYPASSVGIGLSINLWFFLGYQQLMHAGLATYTYLKIVRRIDLKLGKGEWKLHTLVLTIDMLSVAVFYSLGSFGSSGYWFLQDVQTTKGIILGFYISISTTIHALCTTVGYRSIINIVEEQKSAMANHSAGVPVKSGGHHSTASECLTTFVRIAVGIYCPFAILYWIFVIETCFGVMEPFTLLIMVLVANSSGWLNALGYFHNRRVKMRKNKAGNISHLWIPSSSTGSTGI